MILMDSHCPLTASVNALPVNAHPAALPHTASHYVLNFTTVTGKRMNITRTSPPGGISQPGIFYTI